MAEGEFVCPPGTRDLRRTISGGKGSSARLRAYDIEMGDMI